MDIDRKIRLLKERLPVILNQMEDCRLCPRQCRINRADGQKGFCNTTSECFVYAAFVHKGEEPPLSGQNGSGTVFFSGCNLKCVYCQNYKFSHSLTGKSVTIKELSQIFIELQEKGAHNINLVTPTHFLPHIFPALLKAFTNGLKLPLVYNSSGYETIDTLNILDGIVDIYLADMRYTDAKIAAKYSSAIDYPQINKKALLQMYRQTSPSVFKDNVMLKGIIVRNLLLPGYINDSKQSLLWLKDNLPRAEISIMAQYQPYHKAKETRELNRTITIEEYDDIRSFTEKINIESGWFQERIPDESLAGIHFDSLLKTKIS